MGRAVLRVSYMETTQPHKKAMGEAEEQMTKDESEA